MYHFISQTAVGTIFFSLWYAIFPCSNERKRTSEHLTQFKLRWERDFWRQSQKIHSKYISFSDFLQYSLAVCSLFLLTTTKLSLIFMRKAWYTETKAVSYKKTCFLIESWAWLGFEGELGQTWPLKVAWKVSNCEEAFLSHIPCKRWAYWRPRR